jgi:hypothetical protein
MHEHIQDAKHGKLKTPIDNLRKNEAKHMVKGGGNHCYVSNNFICKETYWVVIRLK